MALVKLYTVAHARAGDKGNDSQLSLIAREPRTFPLLVEQVTAERVQAHFAPLGVSRVERYVLPQVSALNFVLHDALAGGVTSSLRLDSHGKSLSYALLALAIDDRKG
jgi:hypothetical protein